MGSQQSAAMQRSVARWRRAGLGVGVAVLLFAAAAPNAAAQDGTLIAGGSGAQSTSAHVAPLQVVAVVEHVEPHRSGVRFGVTDRLRASKAVPPCDFVRLPGLSAPFTCWPAQNEGGTFWVGFQRATVNGQDNPAPFEYVIDLWTVDGTAKAGSDYIANTTSVTMKEGATTTNFAPFRTLQDELDEEEEYFYVRTQSAHPRISFFTDYRVMPIRDDDNPPTVSISDISGAEDIGDLEFDVTLSTVSGRQVTVDYATSDGTAVAPGDYASTSDTLTFPAGVTTVKAAVTLVDDGLVETEESFTVTLSNPVNATVDDGTATGTIEDTGFNPTARVADASVLESAGPLQFVVTVAPAPLEQGILSYATANATATAGSDYTAATGTLTFEAGETSMTVAVPVTGDAAVEPNETLTLTLSQGNGVLRIGDGEATGTIRNDDFELAIVESREGSEGLYPALVFPVTLSGGVPGRATVTVDYATADLTATAGSDYDAATGTLTFPDGVAERSITVYLRHDLVGEADEQFEVVLSNPQPAGAMVTGARSTGTIIDDDLPEITVDDATGSEDAGTLGFAVHLRGETTLEVTVEFETGDYTAKAGEDYTAVDDTLTFAPGETRKTIEVEVLDDAVSEDSEDFDLKIGGPVNAYVYHDGSLSVDCPFDGVPAVFRSCAVGTIEDDDITPTLSVADDVVAETDGELAFVVTASDLDDPRLQVTVDYATSDGTATAGTDYVAASGTLTFTSTTAVVTVAVSVTDDLIHEPEETVVFTLSGPANAELGDAEAEGRITDDDEASTTIALTALPPYLREEAGPQEVAVTATLDAGARGEATAVEVAVSASGDGDAVDFAEVAAFTITIGAGEISGAGTFTLTPEDDAVDENDETVSVVGTSELPVTGTTVELADDDEPSTAVGLSVDPARAAEGGGAVAVTVTATLDGGAGTSARTVAVTVAGAGAADAVDFEPVPDFAITIAAEATTGDGTFTLTPEDDLLDETEETLTVSGTADLPVTPATVTLADDDEPPAGILLTAVPDRIPEGGGTREVAVTAAFDRGVLVESAEVVVTVAGTAGAGAVGFDAVPAAFTVTIGAEAREGAATFSVTPEDDDTDERDEVLAMTGTSVLPVEAAETRLVDDDETSARIVLSASPTSVSEGAGATDVEVTATLDAGARLTATEVSVTVTGSGVPDAVDFDPVPAFVLTIAAETAAGTGTFSLVPDDDDVAESNEALALAATAGLPVDGTSVAIVDDDAQSTGIALSATPERVTEGGGAVEVRVTAALNRAARQTATVVTVSVSGTGATDAVDFAPVDDFTVTIAAGSADGEASFTLTPEDDGVAESDETLTMSGMSDLAVTPASVVLADDDEASTAVTLSATPTRVAEGGGAVAVRVTATLDRSARRRATVVAVSVSGTGSAAAVDFAAVDDFAVTIAAGSASGEGSFTLTPEADAVVESDETLTVSGTSDLPVVSDTVLLSDDDEASTRIVLSASPARVSEGAGPTPVAVTATLDRGLRRRPTEVTVTVAGGGDPEASDFAPVGDFAVTIPAESAAGTGTFTLTPEDDRQVESDDTLTVSGSSDLPVTPTSVVLADDDEVSTRILLFLTVDPAQASEGGGPVTVTVTAAVDRAARPEATRVAVSVSGSGDPLAVDFAPVDDFEIVIAADALEGAAVFTVTPEDDRVVERDETVTVSGVSDLPVTPTTLTLLDDDQAAVELSASPAEVSEGGGPVAVAVTATLTGSVRQTATVVTVTVTGSGAADAVDFATVADFAITIAAGASVGGGSFTLAPEDDAEDEVDETVTVAGSTDLPVTATAVTLVDDDRSAPPALTVADASAAEGSGGLAFAVSLDAAADAAVTVRYATADGTATAGVDYEAAADTLAFAPGELSKTVRVAVLDDVVDEPDETMALNLSVPRNATLARASAVGTIVDDDEPPVLSVSDASGAEGGGGLDFEVTLNAPAVGAVTAAYATADGSAEAGTDYRSASGTLTLAAGETAATIRVELLDDALDEADETFGVAVTGIAGGAVAGDVSATGTVVDDDAPPELSVSDAAGDESAGPLEFAVTLGAPSALEATVDYATADGTATAGSDYGAVSGTLTFAPGEVSRTVAVAVLDDAVHEPDETFVLALTGARHAILGDASGTGTIRDDDLSPPVPAGALPDAALCVGGAAFELDLAEHFVGEEMRFAAVSSTPGVATAALSGSLLAIAPVAEGAAEVTVTASNASGAAEGVVRVRVVTDPAELAAVESLLAAIGRGVLLGVADAVGDRVARRAAADRVGTSEGASDGTAAFGGARGWTDAFGLAPPSAALPGPYDPPVFMPTGPEAGLGGTPTLGYRLDGLGGTPDQSVAFSAPPGPALPRHGMSPFAFALAAPQDDGGGPSWSVWGRGGQRGFEGGAAGTSHDGTLTGVHAGADVGGGNWLAGFGLLHSRAEADYRFARSVEACGGGPDGEGLLETELTGVHPYAGRRVGRGWLWASLGFGRGDAAVERCDSGQVVDADLSMRLAAAGGRHPFGGGGRTAVSVVGDLGVVELDTGSAAAPLGDRAARAGHARLGLEAAGVAPPDCACSLASYVRAYARRDWGDGVTGTGLELAAGVRYENARRRLGVDAGVSALAAHSAQDARERGGHLEVSLLPAADGTGWRAALVWRRSVDLGVGGALDGVSPWTGRMASHGGGWTGGVRVGRGFATRRGAVVPFLEFGTAGRSGGSRLGVRHDLGDGRRAVRIEWGVERAVLRNGTADIHLTLVVQGPL